MQVNECHYCGATLAHSVYKCINCGGQIKQNATFEPKKTYKKRFLGLFLLILILSPIIYKIHLNNTATAVISQLQINTVEPIGSNAILKKNDFVLKAKFVQALTNLSSLKILIVEFLMVEGRYPSSIKELGFNEDLFDSGKYIQAIQLSKSGAIRAVLLSGVFGKKKIITLTPKEFMGGMNIQWTCTSNLEKSLLPALCH